MLFNWTYYEQRCNFLVQYVEKFVYPVFTYINNIQLDTASVGVN